MPIDVVCTGCRTRFTVSDKFAGKKGPCPKCKAIITIPEKGEEVVVHAPQEYGPKSSSGVGVLKPISRRETKVSALMWVGIAAGTVLVVVGAILLRGLEEKSPVLLAAGALILAPPLVMAGYSFLRDDELEPYRGTSLYARVMICSLVYALLWAVYAWVPSLAFALDSLELFHLLLILPPIFVAGAVASFAALDLDFSNALIHYGLYVLVTMALCLIMGVPLLGTPAG